MVTPTLLHPERQPFRQGQTLGQRLRIVKELGVLKQQYGVLRPEWRQIADLRKQDIDTLAGAPARQHHRMPQSCTRVTAVYPVEVVITDLRMAIESAQ